MKSELIALRSELRRKDEFIATLGHELRNPLTVLATAATVITMEGASSAEVKHAATIIGRQVQQVARLVNDLLDLSRIDKASCDSTSPPSICARWSPLRSKRAAPTPSGDTSS